MSEKNISTFKNKELGLIEVTAETEIPIPEDQFELLDKIQKDSESLENARREVGRLQQILYNTIQFCNNKEADLRSKRVELTEEIMGLERGKWVIDFDKKVITKVTSDMPTPV